MVSENKKNASGGSDNTKEKRDNTRVSVEMLVDYKSDGTYLFDFSKDIGRGGIFIKTDNPQPVDSKIMIQFGLPTKKKKLEVEGKVVWVQPPSAHENVCPGMGIQFENFDSVKRTALEELISAVSHKK